VASYELDVAALWKRLDEQREQRGLMWRELARELDLSASTLTRIGQGRRPDADALVTIFVWLDMDTDIVYVIKPRSVVDLPDTQEAK
jgi:transcriptional regulator with XRE-family HTH domain